MQGKETQQGYVLAFSLILLAFASIILISALERTGIEKRIATSELHRATLEAAAEAGSFAFVQALDEKHLDPLATPRNNCETMVDFLWDLGSQEVNADLDLAKLLEPENTSGALGEGVEGNPREFRAQSHTQPLVSWWIDLDPDVVEDSVGTSLAEVKVGCQVEPYRVPFVVKSQVGSLDAPQAILAVGAHLVFERGNFIPSELRIHLKDFIHHAYATGGAVDLSGLEHSFDGATTSNAGIPKVSDPFLDQRHHTHSTGYVALIESRLANPEVYSFCGGTFAPPPQATHIYCSGTFNQPISDDLNGYILILAGGANILNVEEDAKVSIISSGGLVFESMGEKRLTGVVWSTGAVEARGEFNLNGLLVNTGTLTFRGQANINSGQTVLRTDLDFDF